MLLSVWVFPAPLLMGGDVVDDFREGHFPVTELEVGSGVVACGEVDRHRAFVVEGDFWLMIVKAPVGKVGGDDHRLVEKPAAEAMAAAQPGDLLPKSLLGFLPTLLGQGLFGEGPGEDPVLPADAAPVDEGIAGLRVGFPGKGDLQPGFAAAALAFIMSHIITFPYGLYHTPAGKAIPN